MKLPHALQIYLTPSVTQAARSVCVAAIPSQTRATDGSLLPVVLQV